MDEQQNLNQQEELVDTYTQKYFAIGDAKDVASNCTKKCTSFYTTLNANFYLQKLARQWAFYHGNFSDTATGGGHEISFGGEQGELVNLYINHYRNLAEHIINMITANRPIMEARAVNTDYKSLSQTYLANGILDYYMREKKLENAIHTAVKYAVVLAGGYIRMEWNATSGELYDFDPESGERNYTGELEFDVLSPFDVVFDGTKGNWEDHNWFVVRTFKNKYDLMAKFPEKAQEIEAATPANSANVYRMAVFSNDDTDDIPVYEFYHKKTEAMPEGRYIMYVNDNIPLLDLPLPYKSVPIFRLVAAEYLGTSYGYSPMFDVFPIQEALNAAMSTIATNNSAFGVQNLFVKRGSDLDINQLEGALNIIEGNEPPVPLQLTSSSPEIYKFYEMLNQAAETVSGINSVTRGNPEASLKSGTALALVQSMSLQFISGLQNSYVKFIEDLGTNLISILQDYAQTPKLVALVGKNNKPLLKEFVGSDIKDIKRVTVSVGNPLSRTTAGRVQMAEQMLQMGLIKNPQEYFQVINTGSIETMYESDMNENLLIKRENEMLMEGKEVLADVLDAHTIHIMEHRSVMADPDLRLNPELRQVVQDHINQHLEFLRTADPELMGLIGQPSFVQQPMPPQQGMLPPGMSPESMGDINGMMAPPNGMPQGGDMIKGQGNVGAEILPQPAKPPAPFSMLPTNPQDMMPQS